MMRSAQLHHCLESSHLWFDDAANTMVPKDLEKADKLLKEAPGKKDALEQMNTAYQAMYCATMALLHSIHYKASGFRCVLTVLEDYFVKKALLDRAHVDHLLRAQKLEGTPQENIEIAAKFVDAVKKILNQ